MLARTPNAAPIPGYHLLEPLGSGGFGEVWKCEAPGGLIKAIKFVHGDSDGLHAQALPAEEELQAIQRIKDIRHPFILSLDRVEVVGGDLIIVMELADCSLHDLLLERRAAGLPGIPRPELLGYLREAAEALDLMNEQYGLQHLDIKPRNLFLVSRHVKIGDFGLVNRRAGPGQPPNGPAGPGLQLGAITPLYAAPEAFTGTIGGRCDQYSLAIVYQELLTGTLPFQGQNARQLLLRHTQAPPDLDALPEADRPVVARALAKDPAQRYPSCGDFVRALLADTASQEAEIPGPVRAAADGGPGGGNAAMGETVDDLVMTPPPPDGASPRRHGAEPGTRARSSHVVGQLALPGYRSLARLGTTPVTEVWKVQAADGRVRLAKVLYGFARPDPAGLTVALARLAALRHPALAPLEIAQHDPGRLVVVTDLVEPTLWDRYNACRGQGLPGVPRSELLGWLRSAAEALDALARQQGIQHLGLNPRAVILPAPLPSGTAGEEGPPVLIADFGLVQLLWAPAGQAVAELNARYAAPELFKNIQSPACDQFSLALIYHEMLTGAVPQRATDGKQSAAPRTRQIARTGGRLDLKRLPSAERDIIARALDRDPQRRWESCTDVIRSLQAIDGSASGREGGGLPSPTGAGPRPPAATVSPALKQIITELLAGAAVHSQLQQSPTGPTSGAPGDTLRQRFTARLSQGSARQKLDLFRQQWNGQAVRDEDGLYVFQVVRSLSFWQRCIGRPAGLEVRVELLPSAGPGASTTDVGLVIKPFGCGSEQGAQLLRAIGALLLESATTCLHAALERRVQQRLPWPHPVRVRFALPNHELSEAVACRGKDISLTGIGFCQPPQLPTKQVAIELTTPFQADPVMLTANVVRVQRCEDGWYEVGAAFVSGPWVGNGGR
jgi:serine/threonine protein kinase